jgi:teichuronic acid biosynthesis glycosyltransferase TuaC
MTAVPRDLDEVKPAPSRSPLRVLTLAPFYPSADDRASGCFIAEALAMLPEFKIESMVIAAQPFYRGKASPAPSAPAIWVRYLSHPGAAGLSTAGALLFARILGRVRREHAKRPIGVIHAHAPLPCGHAAMLLSRELGIPYAVTVHGLDAFSAGENNSRSGRWCRRVSSKVFLSAGRVICISERVRHEVLQGTGSHARTSVVYNGVDPDCFLPGPEPEAPTILCVGNLIPIKGHDTLIRAVAELKIEFPRIILNVIGDGPLLTQLRALTVELSISDRIRFLGRLPRQTVADAMRQCTLFALPSRYEGLGCVYLEAMSCGKPAIGCRGQGIGDIIQHGRSGFLVGPDNPKELALAVAMLLRDQGLRERIGETARHIILEDLTLRHQAENLARIYRELAP